MKNPEKPFRAVASDYEAYRPPNAQLKSISQQSRLWNNHRLISVSSRLMCSV